MPGDEAVVWATMLSAAATRASAPVYLVGRHNGLWSGA